MGKPQAGSAKGTRVEAHTSRVSVSISTSKVNSSGA